MGSTFVDFQGQGFEAYDATLEVWLHLLVGEIDKQESVPAWLQEARAEWNLQATAGFDFGIMPGLDHFVTSDERRETLLTLCEGAMERLAQYGPTIPQRDLNAMNTSGTFTEDVPAKLFQSVGAYFQKLLGGTLGEEETDARFPS